MTSRNEMANLLKNRVKTKKHRRLWNKIIDFLEPEPRPAVKVIFKDNPDPITGEITGAVFERPGRGHCDKICVKDRIGETRVIRLKEVKDITTKL